MPFVATPAVAAPVAAALALAAQRTVACPNCDEALDVDTTQLPVGANGFQREETLVVGCACCGFAAEKREGEFTILERGTREVGFDKRAYRMRLAALATLTPATLGLVTV